MSFFELGILDRIQANLRTPVGDTLMPAVTAFSDKGIGWLLLTGAFLLFARTRKTGVALLMAICIEVMLCNILLKPLVARQRPFVLNPAVQLLITAPQDDSFPSGHAAVSFACVSVLWIGRSRWRFPAAILAVIIAFTAVLICAFSDGCAGRRIHRNNGGNNLVPCSPIEAVKTSSGLLQSPHNSAIYER